MWLRQLVLVLVALAGIWAGVQRARHAPVRASLAGPTRPELPTQRRRATKLVHVPRPRPASPVAVVAEPPPRPHGHLSASAGPKPVRIRPAKPTPAGGQSKVQQVDVGAREHADTPPPVEPLAISNLLVSAVTSSSARISWQTNVPASQQIAFGLDAPTIWTTPSSALQVDHVSDVTGLEFATTYTAYVHAVDEWNRAQTRSVAFTTGPMLDESNARTVGTRIDVDDRPFFPTAVWAQCSDMFGSNIDDGINLFMGDGCQSDAGLADRLAGRAYSVVDSGHANARGRGVVGWYFPDELDASSDGHLQRADLQNDMPSARPGRISFLTLTNHFYSKAEPLPQGKGMYPVLFQIPDVLGFDLYPLQVWCRPAFGDVYDAQSELRRASSGKPTFQWIEVAPMEHPCRTHSELDPTPATVRAEAWLSIAGGATGIGYFPNHWSPPIGGEVARTNRQIKALTQALLAPLAAASSDCAAVRVSARALNGALYVVAVNTASTRLHARISVAGIAGRSVTVLGGTGPAVASDSTGFTDSFGPLDARVYIVAPAGW